MSKGNLRHGRYVFSFDWPGAQARYGGTIWPTLAKAYSSLNDLSDSATHQLGALKNNPELTPLGRKKQAIAYVNSNATLRFRDAGAAIAAGKERIAEIRTGLSVQVDKGDIAGAIVRAQIRDRLMTMDAPHKAAKLRAGDFDRQTLDAILEAPAFLSGVTEEQHMSAMNAVLRQRSPDAVAEIEAIGEAIDALESAVTATRTTVRDAGGLTDDELCGAIGEQTSDDRRQVHIQQMVEDAA